jgi:predicted amidophosphoribosyltransferase
MVRAIGLLKYQELTRLGAWFANRLNTAVEEHPILREADVIVAVPLHPARRRERGYNQAEVIAKPLARLLRLPLGGLPAGAYKATPRTAFAVAA